MSKRLIVSLLIVSALVTSAGEAVFVRGLLAGSAKG